MNSMCPKTDNGQRPSIGNSEEPMIDLSSVPRIQLSPHVLAAKVLPLFQEDKLNRTQDSLVLTFSLLYGPPMVHSSSQ